MFEPVVPVIIFLFLLTLPCQTFYMLEFFDLEAPKRNFRNNTSLFSVTVTDTFGHICVMILFLFLLFFCYFLGLCCSVVPVVPH